MSDRDSDSETDNESLHSVDGPDTPQGSSSTLHSPAASVLTLDSVANSTIGPASSTHSLDYPSSLNLADVDTHFLEPPPRVFPAPPLSLPGEFTQPSVFLDPSTLEGREYGKDFVYINHDAPKECLESIYKHGLKSLSRCVSDGHVVPGTKAHLELLKKSKHYEQDPELTYFRPLFPDSKAETQKITPRSIVLAVHPNSINVFDQNSRIGMEDYEHGKKRYLQSSMHYSQISELMNKLNPGELLDQHHKPGPSTMRYETQIGADGYPRREYLSEVPVQSNYIDPSLIVPHDTIDERFKEEGYKPPKKDDSAGGFASVIEPHYPRYLPALDYGLGSAYSFGRMGAFSSRYTQLM